MAKLNRRLTKIFAENSGSQGTAVYGSKKMGNVQYSKDIEVLQNNKYQVGREEGVIDKKAPVLQEENTINYVQSYQIKYINQMGVCEWYNKETYYVDSIVNVGGKLYVSLQNDNINHNPLIDTQYWKLLTGSSADSGDKLFDYKISDRNLTLEDPKWIKNYIFTTKQVNGAVKINTAPQTLLDLYNNGTDFSETIAGITIAGKKAQNGMKIVRLIRSLNSYYFQNTGTIIYRNYGGNAGIYYWIDKGQISTANSLKLLAKQSSNTSFSATNLTEFSFKNFFFNSGSDITTKQALLGRDVFGTNNSFYFYMENGSLKVNIYTNNDTTVAQHIITLFSIEISKGYNFGFKIEKTSNTQYTITATLQLSSGGAVSTFTQTIAQIPFGFSQGFFIGGDQPIDSQGITDCWKKALFTFNFFSIKIIDGTTIKEYEDFFIPYRTTELEQLISKTGNSCYWGVCDKITNVSDYITLIPPRNEALIGNQQVDYSSQGLMLNYTARNFNGYSYTATDDCVAFFNSKVMYSYCYAFVNGVQVFNSGMNGASEAVGANSITIPLKKGDVLTFQQESSGGGGSKDSVLYVYRKKYVIDTNRNEQVYYYLY